MSADLARRLDARNDPVLRWLDSTACRAAREDAERAVIAECRRIVEED